MFGKVYAPVNKILEYTYEGMYMSVIDELSKALSTMDRTLVVRQTLVIVGDSDMRTIVIKLKY